MRLGRYAAELSHTLLNIVTPTIESSGIVALDGYRRNTIPAIALHIGEFALRKPQDLQFNTVQRRQIRRTFIPQTAKAILEAHTRHCRNSDTLDDTPIFQADDIRAFVYAWHVTVHNPQCEFFTRSQPIVALNIDAEAPTSPVNLLHELVHVNQFNRYPVSLSPFTSARAAVRRELEAYHISAQTIRGYHDAGRQTELLAYISEEDQTAMLDVDTLRAFHQPTSGLSFHPTDDLIRNLIDNDLQLIDGDLEAQLDMEASAQQSERC